MKADKAKYQPISVQVPCHLYDSLVQESTEVFRNPAILCSCELRATVDLWHLFRFSLLVSFGFIVFALICAFSFFNLSIYCSKNVC